MSATGRGTERNAQDYYYTPIKTITSFLKKFCEVENFNLNKFNSILDPCAGGDEKRECAYPKAIKLFQSNFESKLNTIDIREDSQALVISNYLTSELEKYDLIISNPPYLIFEDFVVKAHQDVNENGYIIFLLRLNATGGQKRTKWWKKYNPKAIYVHPNRPHFTSGGTDACEYAHFVWQKGYTEDTKFYWIDLID